MNEADMLLQLVAAMSDLNVRTATKYISPGYTMRLSRTHQHRKNARGRTFALTLGKPNYEARLFIKRCQKAGEPFPVKRPQLRFWPKKKRA